MMNHSTSESDVHTERFERAFGSVWQRFHAADEPDGLGQLERQVLQHIEAGASPSGVAAHLGLARSTTTMVIKRLQGKGLVARSRSSDDERRVILARTPAGDRLVSASGLFRRDALSGALAGLGARRTAELIRALERLAAP